MIRPLLAAASALVLTACASGPDYRPPVAPVAAAGPFVAATGPAVTTAPALADSWWRLYDDPVLYALVADALVANTDVRQAVTRLERARAALRETKVDRLPQADVTAGAQYGRLPRLQGGTGGDDWQVSVRGELNYEVDLFGRVRRNVEAARGDIGGDQHAYRLRVRLRRAQIPPAPTPTRRRLLRGSRWPNGSSRCSTARYASRPVARRSG